MPKAGETGGFRSKASVDVTPDTVESGADRSSAKLKLRSASAEAPCELSALALFVAPVTVQSAALSKPSTDAGVVRACPT
ncbi:hypothetical protein BE20_37490 [Sorangium cellulosum]|nr:hypothetical protein BE20_37490 [Sorangium cellulosum]